MRPGKSIENAIRVLAYDGGAGVAAEYKVIEGLYGQRNQDWAFAQQRLLLHADRHFDEIKVVLPDDSEEVIYFEISDFYPKSARPFSSTPTMELPKEGNLIVVALC